MLEQTKLRILCSATIAAAGGDGSMADQITLVEAEEKINETGRLEELARAAERPRP